ncbi:4'-phosphopantetheinyl transferase [Pasteurellaceae bacterium Pebbles2]|nr:4'-phosphopantetheinyl transferase [Pasteurellaceae bacterium Pebbles2]
MTTFIAWANIQQAFPFDEMPLALVPEKLRQVIDGNSKVKQRQQCRRLAHFLLWQLCKKAKINTALLADIQRTTTGRPYFPAENIDFNISHSGDWVAVVLNVSQNEKSAVGIDIEFVKKARNYTALLAHFGAAQEQQWFSQQANEEAAFYQIWCGREALLKSQGVGIAKLSEVQHFPLQHQLYSQHCPQGRLIFSAELPFYLAIFGAQQSLDQLQCFAWQDQQLCATQFKNCLDYVVNPTK